MLQASMEVVDPGRALCVGWQWKMDRVGDCPSEREFGFDQRVNYLPSAMTSVQVGGKFGSAAKCCEEGEREPAPGVSEKALGFDE